MAALKAHFSTGLIQLATSSGWKTLLQIVAPTNQRVIVNLWGVFGRGTVNSSQPIRTRIVRQSSAGTGGASVTAGKQNTAYSETVQTTCEKGGAYSVEPTVSGEALDEAIVHPQAGGKFSSLEREQIVLAGGERLGIQYDNDSGTAVYVVAEIHIEE